MTINNQGGVILNLYNEYGIYGIRNKINDKVYVGKTEMNFGDRRDCHFASLRGGYGVNPHLQHAWDKYGEENFEFVVLHSCSSGEGADAVNELEREYIRFYKDAGLAYNISDGGDGGHLLGKHLSDEAKRKIGEKNRAHMTGRKASKETKEKMSASHKARYANFSDEDRIAWGKMSSEKASGYKWSDESKKNFSAMQQTSPNGAKYDVDTVRKIRKLHEVDGLGYTEIASMTGMPRGTIYGIATYRRWANI